MTRLTLWHAPRTRSLRILWLLEELGQPYELKTLRLDKGEHKSPGLLALNPMGKVPVLVADGHPVWESPAIVAHACDLFPESGLGPAPGTPERADFYRWLSFSTAVMEPVLMDHISGHDTNPSRAGWGSLASMKAALATVLPHGPWILGDRFSGADIMVGGNLNWFSIWAGEAFSDLDGLPAYLERLTGRTAFRRAAEIEAGIAEKHGLSSPGGQAT